MENIISKFKEVTNNMETEVGYELLRVAEDGSGRVVTLTKDIEYGTFEVTVESPYGNSQNGFTTLDSATAEFESLLSKEGLILLGN